MKQPPPYSDVAGSESSDSIRPYGELESWPNDIELQIPGETGETRETRTSTRVFNKRKAATLFFTLFFASLLIFTSVSITKRHENFKNVCVYQILERNRWNGDATLWKAEDNVVGWMILAIINTCWVFFFTIIALWGSWEFTAGYLGSTVFILAFTEGMFAGLLGGLFSSYQGQCLRESPLFAAWLFLSMSPWLILCLIVAMGIIYGLGYLVVKYLIPFDSV